FLAIWPGTRNVERFQYGEGCVYTEHRTSGIWLAVVHVIQRIPVSERCSNGFPIQETTNNPLLLIQEVRCAPLKRFIVFQLYCNFRISPDARRIAKSWVSIQRALWTEFVL